MRTVDIEEAIRKLRSQMEAKRLPEAQAMLAKAHASDSMRALDKLTTLVDGRRRIVSNPP